MMGSSSTLRDCNIVSVGKRRDGGTRYWCLEHRADATAKYGRRADCCRYAGVTPPAPEECLTLDASCYPGGIAVWGAAAPVYDTTRLKLEHGVHVHARASGQDAKAIDGTYRRVSMNMRDGLFSETYDISELDAIYFMVSSVFGHTTKFIQCSLCGYPHLDKDWFSVNSHGRHLCSGCGGYFRDTERAVGNPVARIRSLLNSKGNHRRPAERQLDIRQADYPGGVQIWGSNPAIVWTAPRPEEEGIHVHAFLNESETPDIDDTFASVTIDGITLDPHAIRALMAQNALPHLAGRVVSAACPNCEETLHNCCKTSYTPHEEHTCGACDKSFRARTRLRLTVTNPMIDALAKIATSAPSPRRKHENWLLSEML